MNNNIEHYLKNGRYSAALSEARRMYLKAQRERKERQERLKMATARTCADGFIRLVKAI